MALDVDRIQKPARKVWKLLKKMPGDPPPADIHKFRTNSRRVETSLEVLSLNAKGKGRRLSKQIARLRKRAGKIRDMDVMTEYLNGLEHADSEGECLVRLIEYLGARRKKHVKKFQKVREDCRWQMRRGLKRISKRMARAAKSPLKAKEALNGAPSPASPSGHGAAADRGSGLGTPAIRVASSALAMISGLKEPVTLRKDNLHSYRLKVKELRNLLQMGQGNEDRMFVQRLGEVKDAIGEWHDWEVLVQMAGEVLDHGRSCQLVKQLRGVAEAKYFSALSAAQGMRREFLRVSDRRGGKSSKEPMRFTTPVLSVAGRVAA